MLKGARRRARKDALACDLVISDIVVPALCPALGIPIIPAATSRSDNSPSLDRIDNTKGYVRGNVVVVSWLANRMKSNATVEQLVALAAFYQKLLSSA
jgi:uncharacterized membrane protein